MNGKYCPKDTKVGVLANMSNYRKTTMAQKSDKSQWLVLEDRVPAREYIPDIGGQYARCLIFLQEPRFWTDEETGKQVDVVFNAIDPTVLEGFSVGELIRDDKDKVTTLGKNKRSLCRKEFAAYRTVNAQRKSE